MMSFMPFKKYVMSDSENREGHIHEIIRDLSTSAPQTVAVFDLSEEEMILIDSMNDGPCFYADVDGQIVYVFCNYSAREGFAKYQFMNAGVDVNRYPFSKVEIR